MSVNPYKRKKISLEKLSVLRDKVRQAYFLSKKGEVLQTPKNKGNVYYSELKDDISLKTNNDISEGTLLKFFYDDINRNYHVITIYTIEDYVDKILSTSSIEKVCNDSKEAIDADIKTFAKRIYIELSTRKAGIPIDEKKDVIEDIYNSWYKLFCIIREEMKMLPVHCFEDIEKPDSIVGLANEILNFILRPHLTEHQAKYRSWLEHSKKDLKNKNITPQELQKTYPEYKILIESVKEANQMLIDSAKKLRELIE